MQRYPSMPPGAIIGYRKNGLPIRIVAGGSGEGTGEGSTSTTPSADPAIGTGTDGQPDGGTGSPGGTGTPPAQDPPAASTQAGGDDKTARTIEAIRGDFKAERQRRQALERQLADMQTAQAQQAADAQARNLALAKAFGFAPDEPPDPAKLAADLKAAQDQTAAEIAKRETRERELTIELETRRRAAKLGADPDLLADSRSFMTAVAKLNPASDTFADDLAEAITKAVTANPSLKATPAATPAPPAQPPAGNQSATTAPPARSGGEHNGAPGGNRQWTEDDVRHASPSEVAEAVEAGLLVDLGFGPAKKRR